MSKPTESRRFPPGVPRSCLSRLGLRKKAFPTAAQAASHCAGRLIPYQCPNGCGWHLTTARRKK